VAGLAHLLVMDAKTRDDNTVGRPQLQLIEQVLSLSELCAHLHVSAQTIYDLRSQGRGPRGFRVGRELRFRTSEVEAWLDRMERDDDRRNTAGRL
jgi:excisionase family DNA binding protein